MKKQLAVVSVVGAMMGIGCGDTESSATASAPIAPTTGNTVTGTATFTSAGGHVSVSISVSSAPVGVHGMHIHQTGACGNSGMDAGGHWDGGGVAGDPTTHGLPDGTTNHLGDLGNITIAADGTGMLTSSNPGWTLGDGAMTDVVSHAIIFHANLDDGTMASAGARLGCGVIALD